MEKLCYKYNSINWKVNLSLNYADRICIRRINHLIRENLLVYYVPPEVIQHYIFYRSR